jgi:Methyltransferase domain
MHPINKYFRNFGFQIVRSEGKPSLIRTYPIALDYPLHLDVRWPSPGKPNQVLKKILEPTLPNAIQFMNQIKTYQADFQKIQVNLPTNSLEPRWYNPYLSPLDGMSIYAAIASRSPSTYLEIGSGNSTKFARRAIDDHQCATKIISIDPHPRAEVNELCHEIIRKPLEDLDLQEVVKRLAPGDVLFFDGSHRCFQNSDVTVFFNELLWMIPKGVLVGIHDIYLPFDYPENWLDRYYSEQYLLSTLLLADQGRRFKVEFPAYYSVVSGLNNEVLGPMWSALQMLPGLVHAGEGFWISVQ